MHVSVIIPVYNAANFVRYAVESAVILSEVSEIILIEDGSTDDSLDVCRVLEEEYMKVKLYTHAGKLNLGAGASRNLGIEYSNCEWIAFLDADDFYLPNRFEVTKRVIFENDAVEGVGEAISGVVQSMGSDCASDFEDKPDLITTVKYPLEPKGFFEEHAPIGRAGVLSIVGFTMTKALCLKVGGFNSSLRLHQDTEFLMKIAVVGRVYTGEISCPVAKYRRHKSNRITAKRTVKEHYKNQLMMWDSVYRWVRKCRIYPRHETIICRKFVKHVICGHQYESKDTPDFTFRKFLCLFRVSPYMLFNKTIMHYFWNQVIMTVKSTFFKLT